MTHSVQVLTMLVAAGALAAGYALGVRNTRRAVRTTQGRQAAGVHPVPPRPPSRLTDLFEPRTTEIGAISVVVNNPPTQPTTQQIARGMRRLGR